MPTWPIVASAVSVAVYVDGKYARTHAILDADAAEEVRLLLLHPSREHQWAGWCSTLPAGGGGAQGGDDHQPSSWACFWELLLPHHALPLIFNAAA